MLSEFDDSLGTFGYVLKGNAAEISFVTKASFRFYVDPDSTFCTRCPDLLLSRFELAQSRQEHEDERDPQSKNFLESATESTRRSTEFDSEVLRLLSTWSITPSKRRGSSN